MKKAAMNTATRATATPATATRHTIKKTLQPGTTVLVMLSLFFLLGPISVQAKSAKLQQRLDGIEQLVVDQQWSTAVVESQRAIEEITSSIKEKDGEIEALGKLLGIKALAESNLGRLDDALWSWQVGHLLLNRPPVPSPGQYGEAGFLEGKDRNYLPSSVQTPGQSLEEEEEDRGTNVVEAVQPAFPSKLGKKHKDGYIIVKVVVDQQGSLYRPQVEQFGPVKKMVVPALLALRQWKIEPAVRDGRAIAVETTLRLAY